jgi:hypothetical protein
MRPFAMHSSLGVGSSARSSVVESHCARPLDPTNVTLGASALTRVCNALSNIGTQNSTEPSPLQAVFFVNSIL